MAVDGSILTGQQPLLYSVEIIIAQLSKEKAITLEKAIRIYYGSELADKIHNGMEGIQYLDYRVLTQILEETEPDRFLNN